MRTLRFRHIRTKFLVPILALQLVALGALALLSSVSVAQAQQAARQMIASSSSSRTSNVSIGAINVDARGAQDGYAIGDGIRRTLTNSGIVYQAEAGLA